MKFHTRQHWIASLYRSYCTLLLYPVGVVRPLCGLLEQPGTRGWNDASFLPDSSPKVGDSSHPTSHSKWVSGPHPLCPCEMRAGANCIKIGLPGKLTLRDYFQGNMTYRRPFFFTENQFSGKTYFYTIHPWRFFSSSTISFRNRALALLWNDSDVSSPFQSLFTLRQVLNDV